MKWYGVAGFGILALVGLAQLPVAQSQPGASPLTGRLKVPPGFVVELVAAPPLVHYPMMANFDERGRLYIAESSGLNLRAPDLLKQLPNKVLQLDAADAKGRFQKSHVFADRMTFPSGALPYRGSVYVTAAPHIWKLRDTKGNGIADERTELVSKFNFIGNAADLHGPFLGPDGRIYWCDGRHGHEIRKPDGSISKGKAARIFRCKPDGSDVEVVCGGGMDNPVEIAFTDEGEPLVTVDILHNLPSRNDAIIYAIDGGNYPWHEASKEMPRTGDLLPAVADLGWVAPSGLMRYRSNSFGAAYRGNLFSAQFNRHRIQRHIVERAGASFTIKTDDFLTTDDKNFHPTDVFEDADGSILVIDTGGWFRIGCPTSQIARPEFKGAIYRIRKADAKTPADPRGLAIGWDKLTPPDLIKLLDDPRFAVRDRAIDELARHREAHQWLERSLGLIESAEGRRNLIWAATRIDDVGVRHVARTRLNDPDLSVKLVAAYSVGLHRDAKAMPLLLRLVGKNHPAMVRQLALALGRIGDPKAVVPILEAVRSASGDRFLEHALIYALIQIDNRDSTAPYLNDRDPQVRRAALIALDQMPHGDLTRAELAAQLNTEDKKLLHAALDIVASPPKWSGEIVGLLRDWLADRNLDSIRRDNLRNLLLALANEPAIQDLMVQALGNEKTSRANRLLLVDTMGRAPMPKLPAAWLREIGRTLEQPDEAIMQQGIRVIRSRNLARFDMKLTEIAQDSGRSADTRVQAFSAYAARAGADSKSFHFVVSQLKAESPLLRLAAAKALGQAIPDTEEQLKHLVLPVALAGPLELPELVRAFERGKNAQIGMAFVAALERNKSVVSLTPDALKKAVANYPDDVKKQALKLAERLGSDAATQKARLDELQALTVGGSLEQGRDIFFGNKALCSACHAINNRGGGVGPDLGKIGAIRSGRDLLESIVFPSASFARGFETYVVETKAGKTHTGILARESTDAIYLKTTERVEIRVGRDEIETFTPGRVSIMPQGLDAQLSRSELRDLLAYLQALR